MAGRRLHPADAQQRSRAALEAPSSARALHANSARLRLCSSECHRQAQGRRGGVGWCGSMAWRTCHSVRTWLLLTLAHLLQRLPHKLANQAHSLQATESRSGQSGDATLRLRCSSAASPEHTSFKTCALTCSSLLTTGCGQLLKAFCARTQATQPRCSGPHCAAEGVWAGGRVRLWASEYRVLHLELLDTGRSAKTDRHAHVPLCARPSEVCGW